MAFLGSVAGVGVAALLHYIFVPLHRRTPLFIVVTGWMAASFAAFIDMTLIWTWLDCLRDGAPMGPVWGVFALLITVLLGTCVGLSRLQQARFGVIWCRAFGTLMVEIATAVALVFGLVWELDRHVMAEVAVMYFAVALLLTFVTLKIAPVFRRPTL